MQIIQETLRNLEVGEPLSFANLTMFPLIGDEATRLDYATLDEAIEQGWFEVREISDAGSVPQLTVVNSGDRTVLLLDGEELRGAKQNRVLNLTILVPVGKTLVIPVSCVEQGRWASRSSKMASSPDTLYAAARMAKLASVSTSYERHSRPASDQQALWRRIAGKASSLAVGSPTGAMSDIFEQHGKHVGEYERAFQAQDGQRGAVFAIGERAVGLELFGSRDLLRRMLRKIVRSYALDAIEAERSERFPTIEAVRRLIGEIAETRSTVFPAVGLGEDVRLRGDRVEGAGLVVDGRVVHLCAFRADGREEDDPGFGRTGRIQRASRRAQP